MKDLMTILASLWICATVAALVATVMALADLPAGSPAEAYLILSAIGVGATLLAATIAAGCCALGRLLSGPADARCRPPQRAKPDRPAPAAAALQAMRP